MHIKFNRYLLRLTLLVCSFACTWQTGYCDSERSQYKWYYYYEKNNYDYTNTVTTEILVKARSLSELTTISYGYTQLENIVSIDVWYMYKGDKKKLESNLISNQSPSSSSFYSGVRYKVFVMPPNTDFEYKIVKKIENPVLISSCQVAFPFEVDSVKYEIPKVVGFNVCFDKNFLQKNTTVTIDSVKGLTGMVYKITAFPVEQPTWIKNQAHDLRLLIYKTPKDISNNSWTAFNNWYHQLASGAVTSGKYIKRTADSLSKNITDPELKLKRTFDFVRLRVHYLDLENGWGAFKPRPADSTCKKLLGDCKDMATLLVALLRVQGITASIAISATLSHSFDMDFPSLSSANHVIAVAEVNNKRYFLDATESFGDYRFPSRQIQNRKIFIVNATAPGELVTINYMTNSKNEEALRVQATLNKDSVATSFNLTFCGMSSFRPRQISYGYNTDLAGQIVQKVVSNHIKYSSVNIDSVFLPDSLFGYYQGEIKMNPDFLKTYASKKIVLLGFLPDATGVFNEINEESNEMRLPYETLFKTFDFTIKLDDGQFKKTFAEKKIEKNGVEFYFTVKSEGSTAHINYTLKTSDISLSKERQLALTECNNLINTMRKNVLLVQ